MFYVMRLIMMYDNWSVLLLWDWGLDGERRLPHATDGDRFISYECKNPDSIGSRFPFSIFSLNGDISINQKPADTLHSLQLTPLLDEWKVPTFCSDHVNIIHSRRSTPSISPSICVPCTNAHHASFPLSKWTHFHAFTWIRFLSFAPIRMAGERRDENPLATTRKWWRFCVSMFYCVCSRNKEGVTKNP